MTRIEGRARPSRHSGGGSMSRRLYNTSMIQERGNSAERKLLPSTIHRFRVLSRPEKVCFAYTQTIHQLILAFPMTRRARDYSLRCYGNGSSSFHPLLYIISVHQTFVFFLSLSYMHFGSYEPRQRTPSIPSTRQAVFILLVRYHTVYS